MHNIIRIQCKFSVVGFFSSQQCYCNRLKRPNLNLVNDDEKNKGRYFVGFREPHPHCVNHHSTIENNDN